eukprot:4747458-Lingulodinium_polyedra.AAC.1
MQVVQLKDWDEVQGHWVRLQVCSIGANPLQGPGHDEAMQHLHDKAPSAAHLVQKDLALWHKVGLPSSTQQWPAVIRMGMDHQLPIGKDVQEADCVVGDPVLLVGNAKEVQ